MVERQSMSPALDLNDQIHARFHEAFGEPTHSLGPAEQWSLEPSPGAMHIMLFLNGTVEATAVWMLDPYDLLHEVETASIVNAKQIDRVIARIQERVERAGQRLRMDNEAPRFRMFVEAMQSWCNSTMTSRELASDVDIAKLKVAATLIADYPDFAAAFQRFAADGLTKDPEQANNCMCAFLKAFSAVAHSADLQKRV